MRCIIAGTRTVQDMDIVREAIERSNFLDITEVVSGVSAGVDSIGAALAKAHGKPVQTFPADWNGTRPDGTAKGKSAGPERNQKMAEYCDAAILVWDGLSPGTRNLQTCLQKENKPHFILWVKFDSHTGTWVVNRDKEPFWYKPHLATAHT